MNKELVRTITLPDDSILENKNGNYRENARDLVTGVANQEEVEFVLDNLGEAVDAAYTDFCCNGFNPQYFKVDYGNDIFEMTFDLSSLRHLFGLFGRMWQQSKLLEQLKKNHPELNGILNDNRLTWMDKLQAVYNPKYKSEIISHECSSANAEKEKLNWQKMMVKIFSLINLGKLEDGKTILYKEEGNANSSEKPSYLLIRSLRNGELESVDQKNKQYYNKELIIKLVEEKYDGQICLTPQTICIVNKPLNRDGSRDVRTTSRKSFLGKTYVKPRIVTIERLRGNKYAKKGDK